MARSKKVVGTEGRKLPTSFSGNNLESISDHFYAENIEAHHQATCDSTSHTRIPVLRLKMLTGNATYNTHFQVHNMDEQEKLST